MEIVIFGSFFILSLAAYGLNHAAKKTETQQQSVSNVNFIRFQRSFFLVYFLALLGDWLQGPYVYRLYSYCGYEENQIAILYVAGFAASVIFGTGTGPLADIWGRRRVTQCFCLMYSFCCMTKFSCNFWILTIGRIFGGISTSMLFSTFESWYVYEHVEHYGFPSEWIGVTFSRTTFFNGLLAIFAGVLSNFFAETLGYGPVAPFALAVIPLVVCGILITHSWSENHGNRKLHFGASCHQGLREILHDPKILMLGIIQTIIESVMYIFVFLWTPILMPAQPPLGMVFACFMVAIMIGSSIYAILLAKGYKAEDTLKIILVIVTSSMLVCCFAASPDRGLPQIIIIYVAFLILEVALGMYFPAMSYLKSQIIPEGHRANVMNWFRVPMNMITCTVLLSLNLELFAQDKRIIFLFCLVLSIAGLLVFKNFTRALAATNHKVVNDSDLDENTERVNLLPDENDDS